eukprot:COSAG06_NODE_953_length_11329_cov_5.438825_12_plen_96_part_00
MTGVYERARVCVSTSSARCRWRARLCVRARVCAIVLLQSEAEYSPLLEFKFLLDIQTESSYCATAIRALPYSIPIKLSTARFYPAKTINCQVLSR